MRYAFYGHGGSLNHGCEAIIATLSELIKKKDSSSYIKLYTFDKSEDERFDFKYIDEKEEFKYHLPPEKISTPEKIKIKLLQLKSQQASDEYYYSLSCSNPSLKENDVYISVGGDNYCYGDNHAAIAIDKEIRSLGKKTVLWGCSIGSENLTPEKIKDLKGYDLIVARESLTYETLIENGVDRNTVLYPDSAFTLKSAEGFNIKDNTVGINISPLIGSYVEGDKNIARDSAVKLISYLLENTDVNVLLIPHVVRKNCDVELLTDVLSSFDSPRVAMVKDTLSASEYKSIISKCVAFVGARTHATIAAYSTCVPTLVIGYSVKSKGIAKDLFGTDEGLVIPVWELKDENTLTDEFKKFFANKNEYKKRLESIMPSYLEKAYSSVDELFKI